MNADFAVKDKIKINSNNNLVIKNKDALNNKSKILLNKETNNLRISKSQNNLKHRYKFISDSISSSSLNKILRNAANSITIDNNARKIELIKHIESFDLYNDNNSTNKQIDRLNDLKKYCNKKSKKYKKTFSLKTISRNMFMYITDYFDTIDLFYLAKINRRFYTKVINEDFYRILISILKNKKDLTYLLSNDGMMMSYYINRLNLEDDCINAQKFVELVISFCLTKYKNELKLYNKLIGARGFGYICLSKKLNTYSLINLFGNKITDVGLNKLISLLPWLTMLENINLSLNNLSSQGIKEFFMSIKNNNKIKDISISGNNAFSEGMIGLEEFLKNNKSIKSLNLSKNFIQDNGILKVAEGLLYNKSINSIDLSHNSITQDGALAFSEIYNKDKYIFIEKRNLLLNKKKRLSNYRDKNNNNNQDLNFNKDKSKSQEDATINLPKIINNETNKIFNKFKNNKKSEYIDKQNIIINNMHQIQELEDENLDTTIENSIFVNRLSNNNLTTVDKNNLYCNNETMNKYNLQNKDNIHNVSTNNNILKEIESRSLNRSSDRLKTCILFDYSRKNYSSLENINLSNNKINDKGCSYIFTKVASLGKVHSIIELDLSFCGLSSNIIPLLNSFMLSCISIKILNLKNNNFSNTKALNSGNDFLDIDSNLDLVGLFYNTFRNNMSLISLFLDNCNINKAFTEKLLSSLAFNNIEELSLSNSNIDDNICEINISSIINKSKLTSLNISSNQVTDNGIKYLSNALSKNNILEKINLSFNCITDIGLINLIDSIKTMCINDVYNNFDKLNNFLYTKNNINSDNSINNNTYSNIKHLDISCNNITDESVKYLFEYISFDLNNKIESLSLNGCGLTNECSKEIVCALLYTKTLKNLYLKENKFDNTSLKDIVGSCKASISIQELNISKNNSVSKGKRIPVKRGPVNIPQNSELNTVVNELIQYKKKFKIIY